MTRRGARVGNAGESANGPKYIQRIDSLHYDYCIDDDWFVTNTLMFDVPAF
jgi:hypothetical protein